MKNSISIVLATLLLLTFNLIAFEHPGGLHTQNQLVTVREKIEQKQQPWFLAYNALIIQADKNLEQPSNAVKVFDVPGYYDDAEGHRAAMKRLSTDAWTAYSCAMAYQLTQRKERKRYAKQAVQIINSWAKKNKATANYDGDLAMSDAGIGLVLAAELMTDYRGWKKQDRRQFVNWLSAVYLASADSIIQRENNWGDWGALGCIASHYFLDDAAGVARDVEFLYKKIDHEIEADGSMPLETKRGRNGIWYTYFALAPLTAACRIADNATGSDLFSFKGEDGAGIEEALDYLLIYSKNPRRWPHYSEKDLSLPKPHSWPGNLFEAMYGIYEKKEYEEWIKDARPIMTHGHHYAWSFPTLFYVKPITCDDF